MVTAEQIKQWIEENLVESQAQVEGDGHHFEAVVICPSFLNKSKVQCHRMVYAALGAKMGKEIHALSLQTIASSETRREE